MIRWTDMAEVIPEGQRGSVTIEHFGVSEDDAKFSNLRAAISGGGSRLDSIRPGRFVRLRVGRGLMMSDTQMERSSNVEVVLQARGDVLVAGLGVGLIVLPILAKPEVESLTVVEKYHDVIGLVEPALRDHLAEKQGERLRIIEGDIFNWRPPKGRRFDTIYFDIWPDICTDNLEEMGKLHRAFARRKRTRDSWMGSWSRERLQYLKRRGY